ncbi:hypothetical protein ACIPY2_20740 [Paenarthrobacter sp. NPDC089675]|uniref:hypothetical protein n=1 Tax=Paenarthrobacter sp. NPDC089675 TaxID=3364376 RepID=UPI00382753DD
MRDLLPDSLPMYKTNDWKNHVGKVVELRRDIFVVRRGTVEEEMPDGSGIWLSADVNDLRGYFHQGSGYELWV